MFEKNNTESLFGKKPASIISDTKKSITRLITITGELKELLCEWEENNEHTESTDFQNSTRP